MPTVGLRGLKFDAAHYTSGSSSKCGNLHGHTFKVTVEVERPIDPETGMVLDFDFLRRVVVDVLSEYDHKVLLPSSGARKLECLDRGEVKLLKYPHATTEYIAMELAEEISRRLGTRVRLELQEGEGGYVRVEV
ncbi:MAG: 6-carboxytetrahydropterin synthase [Fervidicoccaceae archaeon]